MKTTFRPTASSIQSGVTLVELLISITIGLVLLSAIGLAYVNSTNITRQRENQSELNDPASMVLSMLRRDISAAGYVDIFDTDNSSNLPQAGTIFVPGSEQLRNLYVRATTLSDGTAVTGSTPFTQFFPGLSPIFGCDGDMNGTPYDISITPGPATLACGTASTTKHTLQIAYQAASTAAPPTATAAAQYSLLAATAAAAVTAGEGRDCNQQSLTAAPAGATPAREAKFVINRYFVAENSSDHVNELYCSGSGNSTAQPLVRGVEEFVLRYQTAAPGTVPAVGAPWLSAPNAQQQYASAATVAASALGWSNVTAVEVCIVSATVDTGGAAAATGTAVLQPKRPTCERETTGSNIGNFKADVNRATGDNRLWKRFTSVTTVRNAIFASPL
ncbi:MAG: PilW family protein [Rhodoferax sp.]|nr:PilW family protein [Rhodoferax sp.]